MSPATQVAPGVLEVAYDYQPTPVQATAHTTAADEILYGGAAGGGKTDWLIAEVFTTLLEWPGAAGVIFRRTFPDLTRPGGIIPRLLDRIPAQLGTYNQQTHQWKLRNGSVLEVAHLQRPADVLKYQGAEYLIEAWDELTQFDEWSYLYLRSRLRLSGALARAVAAAGQRPRSIAASNPGGPGHGWVKSRFIDPAPPRVLWQPEPTEEEPRPGTRCFIPARVDDNPHLDEGYVDRLRNLPEDDRRALLDGDWDVYAGQRFRAFRRHVHVIDPEDLPLPPPGAASRAAAIDYGYDDPWCALWGALLPDGLVVVYRELYGPGLTPTEQGEAFLAAEAAGERAPGRPLPVVADPSTWARTNPQPKVPGATVVVGDPDAPPRGSIAWHYRQAGVPVTKATNDRLSGVAVVAEALRVRRPPDSRPRLLIYSTCTNLIRTLPALPRSKLNPEDVDTKAEDHAYDALRYLLMALLGRPRRPQTGPERPAAGAAALRAVTGDVRRMGF